MSLTVFGMEVRALKLIAEKGGSVVKGPLKANGISQVWVRCAAGHEWRTQTGHLVYSQSWCPACYGNRSLTIEAMRALAESRGGKCLSDEYCGLTKHLLWECPFGHQWNATPNNVKNHGSWCPHCHVNVGEELVRTALEEAFPGKSFDRTRRELWTEGLELDGYNAQLRLAFEYQGKQHYERVKHFQRGDDDFDAQLARDALTAERCIDEFVVLLIVPHTVGFQQIRAYVRHELLEIAYDIVPPVGTDGDFYDRVRAQGPSTARRYSKIVAVIERKGGQCLSPQYLGYRVPLRIRCEEGHVFQATPEAIDQPASRGIRFCPECGGTRRQEDHELNERVKTCGYAFLGIESRMMANRSRRYIRVRCPAEHEYWVAWDNFSPTNGVPKRRCLSCFNATRGIAKKGDITQWTKKNRIHPTSEYKNSDTSCEWKCARGHVFDAKLKGMKAKKSACSECGLEDFAADNRLERLTPWTKLCAAATPLTWKCIDCDTEFVASVITLGRKMSLCPECV